MKDGIYGSPPSGGIWLGKWHVRCTFSAGQHSWSWRTVGFIITYTRTSRPTKPPLPLCRRQSAGRPPVRGASHPLIWICTKARHGCRAHKSGGGVSHTQTHTHTNIILMFTCRCVGPVLSRTAQKGTTTTTKTTTPPTTTTRRYHHIMRQNVQKNRHTHTHIK